MAGWVGTWDGTHPPLLGLILLAHLANQIILFLSAGSLVSVLVVGRQAGKWAFVC